MLASLFIESRLTSAGSEGDFLLGKAQGPLETISDRIQCQNKGDTLSISWEASWDFFDVTIFPYVMTDLGEEAFKINLPKSREKPKPLWLEHTDDSQVQEFQ